MIKQLLSIAVMGGFALSAAASVPCPIKHNNNWNPAAGPDWCDGNGFWYEPSSSSSAEEATDPNYVVTCKWFDKSAYSYMPEVGFQLQTASIKKTTDALKITKDHVIVAIDYKTNTAANYMNVYYIYGGNLNGFSSTNGYFATVSDEWQTMYLYCPVKGTDQFGATWGRPADFGIFADESHTDSDYLWIRFENLLAGQHQDFQIQYKLPRWLTEAEAAEELAAANLKGDQLIYNQGPANTDFQIDTTEDGQKLYITTGGNPIINLFNTPQPLNAGNTQFNIEYQVVSGDESVENPTLSVIPMSQLLTSATALATMAICPDIPAQVGTMDGKYACDDEEWGTLSINFEGIDKSEAYNTPAISQRGIWLQLSPEAGFPTGTLFYLGKAWWSNPNASGIEDIAADNAEGPVTYYNLQGVQVANPENGLYIKKQGNTTTKVLVK